MLFNLAEEIEYSEPEDVEEVSEEEVSEEEEEASEEDVSGEEEEASEDVSSSDPEDVSEKVPASSVSGNNVPVIFQELGIEPYSEDYDLSYLTYFIVDQAETLHVIEEQNSVIISVLLIIVVVGLLNYVYKFFKIFF